MAKGPDTVGIFLRIPHKREKPGVSDVTSRRTGSVRRPPNYFNENVSPAGMVIAGGRMYASHLFGDWYSLSDLPGVSGIPITSILCHSIALVIHDWFADKKTLFIPGRALS